MICCRLFALLLLLCFTACGVCSSLFPLFRATQPIPVDNMKSVRYTIYYWYTEEVTPHLNGTGTTTERLYNADRICDANRLMFVVAAALSTAGEGLGGIATLMAATWVYSGFDSCLHSFLSFLTFLSFACYCATVGLMASSFTTATCKGELKETLAIRDMTPTYAIAEGFILLCVAAGGTIISTIWILMNFCVCTSEDDYRGGTKHVEPDNIVVVSTKGGLSRSSSTLSRSRGETGMARRGTSTRSGTSRSCASLSRADSDLSSSSTGSSRSSSSRSSYGGRSGSSYSRRPSTHR